MKKLGKIESHKFCGKSYSIRGMSGVQSDYIGLCNFKKQILHIPIDGDTFEELDIIVHEALHACCPYLGEFEVNQSSHDIARLLWRLKWRKED